MLLIAALLAAAQPCPATPVAPPKELAGWSNPTPVTAALTPAALDTAGLVVGRTAEVALAPAGTLRFAAEPARKPPQDGRGGLVAVDVAKAGTYRVALSAGAWVDMLRDGKAVASTAHGHGAECSGIRKMVDFALQPGRHVIQLSGTTEPKVRLLVAPVG